jgi:hypothetical protein
MIPRVPIRMSARLAMIAAVVVLAGAALSLAVDPGWPRVINLPEGRIVVYEPQVESLEGNILKGRGALSLTPQGKKDPVFGAIWFESRIEIDRDARTVDVLEMKIPRVRFPNSTDEESAKYSEIITREAGKWDMTLSLDRMIAGLNAAKREREQDDNLSMKPPKILFETEPALLVIFDGDPKKVPVQGGELERVVNTPYFMVYEIGSKTYFLNGAGQWFGASAATGPWKPAKAVPAAITKLYDETSAKPADERAAASGAAGRPASGTPAEGQVPKIIVSTEPAELVVSEGKPQFASIAGGDLLYMTNTESNVMLEVASQKYYVLLSGRWFRSGSMEGPWEFVRPDTLPETFAKIPEASDKGEVLAHVAGTPQAEEAVMDAAVPQTAAVKRSEAKLTVEYDGAPNFRKIPGTEVDYAINTSSEVLRIRGKYYACDQAIWFMADSPDGPWVVCDQVPEEVQQIPPDVPVHNVKYVYVYDHTPDTVYTGYLPGYVGSYPYYGTVVYGTGWYYPGWWGSVYYPWPLTYGFHANYNSYYGWSFGFGFGWGWGPFYASFGSWGYPGWWGPVGWVGGYYPYYGYGYHPYHTCYYPSPYYNHGVYYPGTTRVVRNEPLGTNQNLYRQGTNKGRVTATRDKGGPPRAPVARGVPNNVYADPDGNIYRRTNNGWQSRAPGGWRKTAPPPASAPALAGGTHGTMRVPPPPGARPAPGHVTPAPGTVGNVMRTIPPPPRTSLNNDYIARQRGDQRARQYQMGGGGGRPGGAPPPHGPGAAPRPSGGGGGHPSSPPSHGGGGHPGGSPPRGGGGGHPHH